MTGKTMSGQTMSSHAGQARKAWQAPAVDRFDAGSAETGPGASGETSSLS